VEKSLVVYFLWEEEKKISLSAVNELKGDDAIYRCQMSRLVRGSCPSQTSIEPNGSLVNSFAGFSANLQATQVALQALLTDLEALQFSR